MSGGASSIRYVQVGTQTGTTDTPGAFTFLDVQNDPTPDVTQSKIPVKLQTTDGEVSASVLGPKTASLNLQLLARGQGTGAGAGQTCTEPEIGIILDALCGSAGDHWTGFSLGASSHTNSVLSCTDTSGAVARTSDVYPPSAIMIDCSASDTYYCAREIASLVTDTSLTLARALPYNPDTTTPVAYAASTWAPDADDTDHSHLYFKVEGENWRRDLKGCGVTLSLNCTPGQLAMWDVGVQANDWEDAAEETPTYSAHTTAGGIVCTGMPFWLEGVMTELIECKLDLGFSLQPRTASEGANGQNGWVYVYEGAKFSGKIYHNDTTMAAFNAAGTHDIAFQVGDPSSSSTPGNAMYIVIPALQMQNSKLSSYNGVDAIDFDGIATRPGSTDGLGSVRINIFGFSA